MNWNRSSPQGLFLMQAPARRVRPAWAILIRFEEEAGNDD